LSRKGENNFPPHSGTNRKKASSAKVRKELLHETVNALLGGGNEYSCGTQ